MGLVLGAMLMMASLTVQGQAASPDSLARARQAYNAGQFDAAIAAAGEAMRVPALSNVAAVVLARAHLERYREHALAADLTLARAVLSQVRPDLLAAVDRSEFWVGLGLSLYFDGCTDGCFTAAAEFFAMALDGVPPLEGAARDRLFDWWAGALDRQAQFGPEGARGALYRRLLARAEAEQARDADAAAALYWIAAASRGAGDLERAWGAAIAGWVRGRYLGARGEALRADLDRFVTQVLLPERAKALVPDADARPALAQMIGQWGEIKDKYR